MSEGKGEKEKFRITLDRPDNTYLAGEIINGEIWLNLEKRTKIKGIKVELRGKGKCKWMEILRKNSNAEGTRSLFYSGKAIYEQSVRTLPVFEPNGAELKCGEHRFPFSTSVAITDPSSFKGNYGSIKYKLVIVIQKPWQFDERHRVPITVIKYMPLSMYYRLNPVALTKQITKTISLFGTKPISMLAILPEDFAVRGEPMRVCVTVTNNSTTNIEKLRFTILQNVTYISSQPLRVFKKESYVIANKETGSVQKKSERSFAHEILVPSTAQPTDTELSWCINIEYILRIEAVLRGFFKNLVLNLPFKIYSHEIDDRRMIDNREPVSNNIPGNPFETASIDSSQTITSTVVNNLTYPTLDRSCTSPTYSSQFSESSSVSSSVASDSSTATLSPAMGAMEISYTSGSSSLYNSPSTRASLRSSNVPYMPYSTSPSMYNSYPPATYHEPSYRLPDSPQYQTISSNLPTGGAEAATYAANSLPTSTSRLNEQRTQVSALPSVLPTRLSQLPTDLPTRLSQLPSTSSALSFLQPRLPPEAHELPPSYEELFGNASAPPFSDELNTSK